MIDPNITWIENLYQTQVEELTKRTVNPNNRMARRILRLQRLYDWK